MNEEWRIKNFTKWDIEDEFSLNDAAHLFYAVDPNNSKSIPEEISIKVSEMLDTLSTAAKRGTLYEPEFRSGAKARVRTSRKGGLPGSISYHVRPENLTQQGIAYRDDLKHFFSEKLGQKPLFLFPEERDKPNRTLANHEEDFEVEVEDYKLWDLRTEVTFNQAACLLLDLDPNKCLKSRYDLTYMEELAYHKDLPGHLRGRIETVRGLLKEARGNKEFGPQPGWMAMPYTPTLSIKNLKVYAEKNGFRPKSLFPELRKVQKGREESEETPFKHSPDFRSVSLRGREFTLTPRQAQVVEILYKAYTNGTPNVGKDYILEKLESPSSRLRDTFKNSSAWDTLIIKGEGQGTYRLNI